MQIALILLFFTFSAFAEPDIAILPPPKQPKNFKKPKNSMERFPKPTPSDFGRLFPLFLFEALQKGVELPKKDKEQLNAFLEKMGAEEFHTRKDAYCGLATFIVAEPNSKIIELVKGEKTATRVARSLLALKRMNSSVPYLVNVQSASSDPEIVRRLSNLIQFIETGVDPREECSEMTHKRPGLEDSVERAVYGCVQRNGKESLVQAIVSEANLSKEEEAKLRKTIEKAPLREDQRYNPPALIRPPGGDSGGPREPKILPLRPKNQ